MYNDLWLYTKVAIWNYYSTISQISSVIIIFNILVESFPNDIFMILNLQIFSEKLRESGIEQMPSRNRRDTDLTGIECRRVQSLVGSK